MKLYIFTLEIPFGPIDINIEAEGMLDAFTQAKEYLKKAMIETSAKINIQFKGTVYFNSI
ncbi:hypothetical protein [Radiobacillus sp. PE A8.2]|uniref:hypothetical protein n=1 Tax=Radiobacillus sp. PE A8.2 TaxID=3380349 RepID=UPI00388D853D